MILRLKNRDTLVFDEFEIKCAIGKKGINNNKIEGDKTTPRGIFEFGKIYWRKDKVKKPDTKIKTEVIRKNMIWCDDPKSKFYNKLTFKTKSIKSEKLYRNDNKYDYLLIINYNTKNIKKNSGSAIFLHLTTNYAKTDGCIAVRKKDFLILSKVLTKKSKIIIT